MSEPTASDNALGLNYIDDPDVRRVLRAIHEEITATLNRQELEIEALLELLMQKRLGSLGEFRLALSRLQHRAPQASRLAGLVESSETQASHQPGVTH